MVAQTAIEANEYRIKLEAQRAITKEAELSAGITVQADRITSEVEARVRGEVTINSKITQTAQMIQQEVTDRRNADNVLSGRITVEAGKITQIVSAVGKNGQVTAASICLAINNGGSTATINADKIYLLGQTIANQITADYIQTKIASLASLNVASLKSDRGSANVYGVKTTTFEQGGVTCYVPNAIWTLQITQSGNTYKLQRKRYNDSDWVDVGSFSRATSLSGSWSSGTLTVTASPQGNTYIDVLGEGSSSWSGGTCTIPIRHSQNGSNWYDTGKNVYAYVNKSDISIPTSWTTYSTDPDGDVKVELSKSYTYHKCTVNVHGRTKTIRVKLT